MFSFLQQKVSALSDKELIQRYKKSKNAKYPSHLMERYGALIYGVCLKYLREEMDAEDAFMQIYEKLLDKLQTHEVQNVKGWLSTLTRNHCLEILRQKKKHLTVSLDKTIVHNEPFLHPFEKDNKEDSFVLLEQCLEGLDNLQKICIQLFYYQNNSYKEIANAKDLPLGKVRSYIQNGRRKLKICMESAIKSQQSEIRSDNYDS